VADALSSKAKAALCHRPIRDLPFLPNQRTRNSAATEPPGLEPPANSSFRACFSELAEVASGRVGISEPPKKRHPLKNYVNLAKHQAGPGCPKNRIQDTRQRKAPEQRQSACFCSAAQRPFEFVLFNLPMLLCRVSQHHGMR
jgi:hypothetical protein